MGWYPDKICRANDRRQVLAHNKNNFTPDPSEEPVVASGTARASDRSGEKGLTASANPGHERALVDSQCNVAYTLNLISGYCLINLG